MRKSRRPAPFFGLNDDIPVVLALLLGFQHALSMLAGVITPPIIIAGQGGANLGGSQAQYLVSTSLIVCGVLSAVQITRFHIYKSPYFIGTGLISVVGTSFSIIPVATGGWLTCMLRASALPRRMVRSSTALTDTAPFSGLHVFARFSRLRCLLRLRDTSNVSSRR